LFIGFELTIVGLFLATGSVWPFWCHRSPTFALG